MSTHQAAQGIKGDTGNGISDISFTSSEENVDTYTITFTNGGTTTFTVTNGKDGAQGIQGIQGVPGKDGRTPVITIVEGIWHVDGVSTHQAAQGVKGDVGNGISDISLTAQIGNIDTYTITYTNGSITTFTVTNGKDGAQGIQGIPGKDGHTPVITIIEGEWYVDGVSTGVPASVKGDDGNGISSIFLSSSEGLVDTYTVIYTNGGTTTFTVTNGAQGIQGIQGIPGKDGHTPVITIVDGFWCVDGENTHQWAIGVKGDVGNGISDISLTSQDGNTDTYTITFTDGNTTTFTVTNGKDGESVRLGENGNWWIGATDTGVKAKGDYELMYNSAAVSVDWYDESESVYYINDIYDFNGIAYLVNEEDISFEGKTIILNADLDFEGVRINTIGDFRNSFRGTFDGGNHSLFGIKWDERYGVLCEDPDRGYNGEQLRVYILGLFYYNYGTIKNIEIRGFDIDLLTYDAFINAHTDACSLLAVNNYGQISGIRAYGSSRIVADGKDDSSGSVPLVKYNVGTVSDCEIVMNTELAVTTRVRVATVVSQNDGIVKDCDVSGNVLLKIVDGTELSVGGVVLVSTRGSSIIGCTSSVNVVIDGGVNSAFIGGIAADVDYGTVDDCMFDGVVRVNAENDKTSSWYVAGIVASMLNNSEYARSEVIDCTSSGEIFVNIKDSVYNTDYLMVYVGGIIADGKFNGLVDGCLFMGRILVNFESGSEYSFAYIGGIFGDNDKGIHTLENNDYTTTVTDCVNAGQIYLAGDFHSGFVGGIAGRTYLSSYVDSSLMNTAINKITYDSCRFEGEIKASNDRQYGLLLGGIAARAGSVTLKGCSVSGRVELTSLVDICYGEVVADAGYSVFLDGGKTKTRVENCAYGNTVCIGLNEYNLKNIMGISDTTEFVMPITAEQLLGKENYALLSGGEREFYIQLFTWATEISNHEYAYEYEKLYGVFSGGFYGMIVLEPYGIDPDRAVDIYNLFLFDFPELVRLTPTGAAISTDGKEFAFSLSDRYDGSAHSEADDIASLDAIVDAMLNNTAGMSDYEKLEYAFELLLSASEYAFDGEGNPITNENTITLIGALIDGYAVCEGYAMAFNFLCDALGISSFVIVSEELDHAWNIVELDGAWYFVDTTWSDTSSDAYFLLGGAAFEESHGTFDELLDYPELSENDYTLAA